MTQQPQSDGSAGSLPPRQRRLRRWLKIGAILIALLVLGSFFDYVGRVREAIFPWAGWFGYTQATTPVDTELHSRSGVTRLRIPKSYLTFRPNWDGGRQHAVVLEAVLPDMRPLVGSDRPAPEEVTSDQTSSQDGQPDSRVYIEVKPGRPGVVADWVAQDLERWEFQGVAEDGLRLYYEVQRNPDGSLFNPNKPEEHKERQLVALAEGERPMVHFDCPPTGAQYRAWRCSARTDFHQGLLLRYIFSQAELHRWHEIDQKARELLASFVVEFRPAPASAA